MQPNQPTDDILALPLPPWARRALGLACLLGLGSVLALAWSIPFRFISTTMLYKFGPERLMLRSAKLIALTMAVLLVLQVILASRPRFLDRIFALDRLYAWHRRNGIAIAVLIPLHGFLVIAAEKFVLFRPQWRYLPEFLGLGLAIFILSLIAVALLRPILNIRHALWARWHHAAALLALTVMPVHILLVSDSFRSGPPRIAVLLETGLTMFLFFRLWGRRLFPRRFVVSAVRPAGMDATLVEAVPQGGAVFPYFPGQFAFIRPVSGALPREEHPFTIASPPTRPEALQFIIRACGTWSRAVPRLKKGDIIAVAGPYGLFSHHAAPGSGPLVMIAGGIGITPILSMLRTMADRGENRPVLLLWSNRTREHLILPAEFAELAQRLPNLTVVHLLSRDADAPGVLHGRLDQKELAAQLGSLPHRETTIFLCGPEAMMKQVHRALKNLGFPGRAIRREVFSL
jgi:predicted ferric reductase